MTFYPLSMLTYHLKSCAISSPIFSTASTISRICSPVILSICTPPVQTDFFRQHPAQYLIFMSGAVPHRGSRTPAPVSGQRFSWYGLHHTADMRLFSSGETDLKVLTELHYRHFHRASCGCCLFCQHSFHLRYSFTSTPNGESSLAARCVTISSMDSGF